jgi:hypothetical protein
MGKKKANPHRRANPEQAAALRGLRRSSATQRHTVKTRKGSRAHRRRLSLADQELVQGK